MALIIEEIANDDFGITLTVIQKDKEELVYQGIREPKFKVGDIVRVKSKEELKNSNIHILLLHELAFYLNYENQKARILKIIHNDVRSNYYAYTYSIGNYMPLFPESVLTKDSIDSMLKEFYEL